jgi:cardiolipin synthase (CMP-forming)
VLKSALSPPNLLTYARLVLIPFIVRDILNRECGTALAMIALAGLSDGADGFLARRFHWQTQLGSYLDPIADKFLVTAVYLSLTLAGLAPGWLVWLIIGRDLVILAMVASALAFTRFRDFPPSIWGKINTALEIATALTLLTSCAASLAIPSPLATSLIWTTAASTAWSGLHYVVRSLRTLRAR